MSSRELLVSSSVEEHQQHVQGRRYSGIKRARIFPSRLSRMESAPICSKTRSMAPRMTTKAFALGKSWKMSNNSNSRWWEDFRGARMSSSFRAVLMLLVAATFVFSVYLHHKGLTSRLFVASGMSPMNPCIGSSIVGGFPFHDDGRVLQFDMTVDLPGC